MPPRRVGRHPEPVPGASQFAALPFLAAVEGYLRPRVNAAIKGASGNDLRVVLHRTMSRDGEGYLQQLCPNVGDGMYDPALAGRIYPVTEGIIGRANASKKVVRTRRYDDVESLMSALTQDMKSHDEQRSPSQVGLSYLAIPFLGTDEEAALILFADSKAFNLFADNETVVDVVSMCQGFCRTVDQIVSSPLAGIRNYPLEPGAPVREAENVYPTIQEAIEEIAPPRFTKLKSFNFESTS